MSQGTSLVDHRVYCCAGGYLSLLIVSRVPSDPWTIVSKVLFLSYSEIRKLTWLRMITYTFMCRWDATIGADEIALQVEILLPSLITLVWPQDLWGRKTELFSPRCLLYATCMPWHMTPAMNQKSIIMKKKKDSSIEKYHHLKKQWRKPSSFEYMWMSMNQRMHYWILNRIIFYGSCLWGSTVRAATPRMLMYSAVMNFVLVNYIIFNPLACLSDKI